MLFLLSVFIAAHASRAQEVSASLRGSSQRVLQETCDENNIFLPNDADAEKQWHLGCPVLGASVGIDAVTAWKDFSGAGKEKVTIALVSFDNVANHSDWQTNVSPGTVFRADGVGIRTVGVMAADSDNSRNVAGVCPFCKVLPIKISQNEDRASQLAQLAGAFAGLKGSGIMFSVVNVDVTVGELITRTEGTPLGVSLDSLLTTGHVMVVGAGVRASTGCNIDETGETQCDDDADRVGLCKHAHANILCVGASKKDGTPIVGSNVGGTSVDLFAPGEGIVTLDSCGSGNQQCHLSTPVSPVTESNGYATAIVGAMAAMYKARKPLAEAAEIKSSIAVAAKVTPVGGLDGLCVSEGVANMNKMYEGLTEKDPWPVEATTTSTRAVAGSTSSAWTSSPSLLSAMLLSSVPLALWM